MNIKMTFSAVSMALILSACAGTPPTNLGLNDGEFAPCPDKPNCVSSFATTEQHGIEALKVTAPEDFKKLAGILKAIDNCAIITEEDAYIRAEFTSSLMGYVDDVEFALVADTIHVRSASRLGYSDLGVNRERIESIRAEFAK